MKESFILYQEQKEIFEALTDEQAGRLIKAIFDYASPDNEDVTVENDLKLAFIPIRQQLDRNAKKYSEVIEKRRIAGAKGSKVKQANAKNNLANQANANFAKNNSANLADNDNVNVNDNVYVNDNVIENKTNILHISPKPKKEEIQKFAKEIMSKVDIDYFFQYYEASDWCDQYGARINWKQKLMNWSVKEKTKLKEATNGQQPYNPYL